MPLIRKNKLDRLTPPDLSASFVTLTLEAWAKLQQVHYAVGQADPRTSSATRNVSSSWLNAADFLDL